LLNELEFARSLEDRDAAPAFLFTYKNSLSGFSAPWNLLTKIREMFRRSIPILEAVLEAPDAAVDDKAREVPGPTTDEPPVDWLMHVHRDFFLTLTSV
jgi:hypothetical protein